jgi:hypothetical protein
MSMKLYRLYWKDYDYDQYSGAIVVADSEEDARKIHPHYGLDWKEGPSNMWCAVPQDVTEVECIGEADPKYAYGDVILSSFHAG